MPSKLNILLVEDNEPDILLTAEMLQQTGIDYMFYTVNDGVKAIDFIQQQNGYHNVPVPELIILDINLPKKDGRQLLQWIRTSAIKNIPVIIYTSSALPSDITACKAADLYLNKPVLIDELDDISHQVKQFILNHFQ